jgi:hypothetical protein
MASVVESPQETSPAAQESVAVGTTVPAPTPQNLKATKLIVAVHGVGDQSSYATLQSVFNQFCRFHGEPSGIPLGAFHNGQSTFSVPANERKKLESLAFAEVYWAGIPREVVKEEHTLEEAKRWATTIIERLRLRNRNASASEVCRDQDFELSTQILHEMIGSIAVADRLCYLADRAGIFTFDLRKVLDDYLGDVQIVTEFRTQRQKILDAFKEVMTKAQAHCPNAEIYIIAHSEGTVVALLGLLEAFRKGVQPAWAGQVRGLMTLGSPIDKHLFFWPELFGAAPPEHAPAQPIRWRNYYDYGDPIGFELDGLREWLARPRADDGARPTWRQVFEFEKAHDFGFTRYPFPGKAHVDYWKDGAVFTHFIGTVIDTPAAGQPATRRQPSRPRSISASWVTSWILPYVGVFALLCIAAYVFTKAVFGAMGESGGTSEILAHAVGGAFLLFGITIAARVPRLTRSPGWWAVAGLIAVACGAAFLRIAPPFDASWRLFDVPSGTTRGIAALLVVATTSVISAIRPQWGAAPMVVLGGVALATLVAYVRNDVHGSIWPVFPAGAAFLYLWWLAALLFDLILAWHLYIRSSLVNRRLRAMIPKNAPSELAMV